MVECKLPEYKIEIAGTSDEWFYVIKKNGEPIRNARGFTDKETALQWGRRALWCLSLGD